MGLRDWIGRLAGPAGAIGDLASVERVAALVPGDAGYVTAAVVLLLRDAEAFQGGPPGEHAYGRDLAHVPQQQGEQQEPALLVLTGDRFAVVGERGERWVRDVAQLADLDGHRRSGFVLVAADGSGVAAATPTPVQIPPGAGFRTVPTVSNLFGAWDEVLGRHGVRVHR